MSKIKSLEELKRIRYSAAKLGRRFVFTNGCFDILHVGHLRSLEEARRLGDVLVVAINSDESLRALKKLNQPVTVEAERAELLAGLSCVDYVVSFDSPTADGIISELRPDVCAKGTDYTEQSVPERETIIACGGVIAITGDPKAHSTKDIIAKIKSRV